MTSKRAFQAVTFGTMFGVVSCWLLWVAGTHWDVFTNILIYVGTIFLLVPVFVIMTKILLIISGTRREQADSEARRKWENSQADRLAFMEVEQRKKRDSRLHGHN